MGDFSLYIILMSLSSRVSTLAPGLDPCCLLVIVNSRISWKMFRKLVSNIFLGSLIIPIGLILLGGGVPTPVFDSVTNLYWVVTSKGLVIRLLIQRLACIRVPSRFLVSISLEDILSVPEALLLAIYFKLILDYLIVSDPVQTPQSWDY